MTLTEELETLGIPSDRAKLIARNVELKGKLNACRKMLAGIIETQHKVFEHPETLAACEKGICKAIREMLEKNEP